MGTSNNFLGYEHGKGDFHEIKDQSKFQALFDSESLEISKRLSGMGLDGILIFNREKEEWHLIFGDHLGLVAQRTGRRQADTISRSGFLIASGERVGAKCRMEQLTEDNIGDLSKTVQEKYIETDLGGFQGDSRQDSFPKKVFSQTQPARKTTFDTTTSQPTAVVEDQKLPQPSEIYEPKPIVEPTHEPAIEPVTEKSWSEVLKKSKAGEIDLLSSPPMHGCSRY